MRLGRNDQCHCGSGMKYKKCCMTAKVAANQNGIFTDIMDFQWQKLRKAEGELVDDFLFPHAVKYLPEKYVSELFEDLFFDGIPKNLDQEIMFSQFFIPWLLFDWLAEDDFGKEDIIVDKKIAISFMDKFPSRLNSFQKQFIKTIDKSYWSFYQIKEIVPNQALVVKDILLGSEHIIRERLATDHVKIGNIMFARILTLEGRSIFVGSLPYQFSVNEYRGLIDFREFFCTDLQNDKLEEEDIVELQFELIDFAFMLLDDLFSAPMPELRNSDGDEIAICKSIYDLKITPKQALKQLLPITLSDDIEDFPSIDGVINIPWLKKGNKIHKNWDNTLLGDIDIEADQLTLTTNSEKRSVKGEKLIEKYLGTNAIFKTKNIDSSLSLKNNKPIKTLDKDSADNSVDEMPEEMLEYIKDMIKNHWDSWFDTQIPMLDNMTPREAAKDRKGLELLEALLLDLEAKEEKQTNKLLKPDINYIRSVLKIN